MGIIISDGVKLRQIALSKARMAHFTGFKLPRDTIHPGMNTSGIMPPPNMAITSMTAQSIGKTNGLY